MSRQVIDDERPDRLYTVTGGRSRVDEDALDLVTLIVSECDPSPGMQSEHVKILRLCHRPMAVVEVSSYLDLPVSVVRILLCDLLDTGRVTARHPSSARVTSPQRRWDEGQLEESLPGTAFLKKVLIGLQRL
jgi:uncharacterized protein DUF742